MVSIIVTLVMMVVISLIVLGFAQISRRAEREALDQQLSTQAFLAAETGVNDAYEAIRSALAAGKSIEEKDTCPPPTDPSSIYAGQSNILDPPTNSVSYSCLLVSTQLHNIIQTVPADGTSVTLPLHPADPALDKIGRIDITWSAPSPVKSVAACAGTVPAANAGSLPPASSWKCPYSLLRVELVPTDSTVLNRTDLINDQVSVFMYPTRSSAGTIAYGSAKGAVAGMRCDTTSCRISITNVPSSFTNYQLRLSSTYQSGGIFNVSAESPGGAPIELKDAQIAIDSTGKAQDVLRRIQARMSLSGPNQAPSYALESGSSICKRFGLGNGFTINGIIGQDSNNPYCNTLINNTPPPPGGSAPDPGVCPGGGDDITFVVDASDSMRNPWDTRRRYQVEQDVMRNFFNQATIGPNANHVAIVQFNDTATVLANYTSDITALNTAMTNLTFEFRTRFSVGLDMADALIDTPQARQSAHKVVIFMTDGEPSPLGEGPAGVSSADKLKKDGVEIYSIGILSELWTNHNYVPDIATDSAHYADANDTTRFNDVLSNIAREVSCK